MASPLRTILSEGFRVFFLAAPVWAVVAMSLWLAWLGNLSTSVPAPAPSLWHAHEMVFGYGGAALGGFFLTAAPNWTGSPAAGRTYIAVAAGLWLAGRVAVWFWGVADPLLVALIDLAFLPMLGLKLAVMLARRPKPQNVMFLALLAIVWLGALNVHLDWLGFSRLRAETGVRVGLLGLAAMISVLGGRITPAFTRNAMTRAGIETGLPQTKGTFDAPGIAAAIALPLCWLAGLPAAATATVALAAGVLQALRLAGWRSRWALGDPLLWTMHVAYTMLVLGYLALGLAGFGIGSETGAFHLLGIGAVGGMTIAVMSRAVLGHSGRALIAPPGIAVAFALMPAAAALRWAASSIAPAWHLPLTMLAGVLWLTAFAIFLGVFWPILSAPPQKDA